MLRIGVILGSTRPGRLGKQVADWVMDQVDQRSDAQYELIDLVDHPLPHLDEEVPPAMGRYQGEHTKRWADLIDGFDGFVVVTPEYNHSIPGVLKNAFDYLYAEWNNKAIGFVSYGAAGGVRAVEHLRLIAGELQLADVRESVSLPFAAEFEQYKTFTPSSSAAKALDAMLKQLLSWTRAMEQARELDRRDRIAS
jgi:NAD(P)H-dependent FMN reductase